MIELTVLPRYSFLGASTYGCATHNDPDCLCDVTVTNPVGIRRDVQHMFHSVALRELGDDLVCERNIVEFFSIVLGCHQLWVEEIDDSELALPINRNPMTGRNGTQFGPAEWQALPDVLRERLRLHYKVGTPWRIASIELESFDVPSDHLPIIRKYYDLRRRNNKFTGRNRKGTLPTATCCVCGTTITNVQGIRTTCSQTCRNRKSRMAKKKRDARNKEQELANAV